MLWFPLLRCFTPQCTPTIQLGTKIIFIYSCRLSSCYLYGERCNTVKINCGFVWLHLSFLLCALGYFYATKLMYLLGHIFKNISQTSLFLFCGQFCMMWKPAALMWHERNQLYPASLHFGALQSRTNVKLGTRVPSYTSWSCVKMSKPYHACMLLGFIDGYM